MLTRGAFLLAIALSVCACAPARLEGYGVILCSGASVYGQLGIDLKKREFGMLDFRDSFHYCTTNEYYCMRAPILVSAPKKMNAASLDHGWEIEGVKFRYVRKNSGFQIIAVSPPDDLSPTMTESTNVFSEDWHLVEIVHRSEGRVNEVQRVCHGRLGLKDLF